MGRLLQQHRVLLWSSAEHLLQAPLRGLSGVRAQVTHRDLVRGGPWGMWHLPWAGQDSNCPSTFSKCSKICHYTIHLFAVFCVFLSFLSWADKHPGKKPVPFGAGRRRTRSKKSLTGPAQLCLMLYVSANVETSSPFLPN